MTERLLRRREALLVLGASLGTVCFASRAGATAAAASTCVLSPEQIEGPFYVAPVPFRTNVTEGHPGVPLRLRLRVRDTMRCRPIKGATVEIWHADAAGDYSGVNGTSTTFMRGRQITTGAGRAAFTTIYPGWYSGRTTHIHVKVHAGGAVAHTGQLYFDDPTTDAVYAAEPYATRGPRDTANADDFIYGSGGAESMLTLRQRRGGYTAMITLVVQRTPL